MLEYEFASMPGHGMFGGPTNELRQTTMPTEQIGRYEIEYRGARLPDSEAWAAFLAIFGPSSNPMHRNSIFPEQRVCIDTVFPDQKAAEVGARAFALTLIGKS